MKLKCRHEMEGLTLGKTYQSFGLFVDKHSQEDYFLVFSDNSEWVYAEVELFEPASYGE